MDLDISAFFAPIVINRRTANRFSVAPMTRITGTQDGLTSVAKTRHHDRRSEFGIAADARHLDQRGR
jgi:2,4-dienoyl-CoA reductase-like NADH-dependent reductase (Old Yellow Enzyme family)